MQTTAREQLQQLVEQWNENRLDLFSLSYPTEDLEIHGVMRFYFQDDDGKVSTKCMRVSSTATSRTVIDALVNKFHPDLKMLTNPEYSLHEVHENGYERCLSPHEKPLLVQLNWHKDDREGRFLLKSKISKKIDLGGTLADQSNHKHFSKKEEKEMKKKHQKAIAKITDCVAEQLYKALPPTTFTRTISNPEIVMKKRREKKLASKLKHMGQGGSLKIYGYEVEPSRPYVTLLVSIHDRVTKVLEDALEKYGIMAPVTGFQLVEVIIPFCSKLTRSLSDLRTSNVEKHERIMHYDECPLVSLASRTLGPSDELLFVIKPRRESHHTDEGSIFPFYRHLAKPRPSVSSDIYVESTCSLRSNSTVPIGYDRPMLTPCLVQLKADGNVVPKAQPFLLPVGTLSVGSDCSMGMRLNSNCIRKNHALFRNQNGIVTITPSDPLAGIEVDNKRIQKTVALQNGNIIRLGHIFVFRFFIKLELAFSMINVTSESAADNQPLQDHRRLTPSMDGKLNQSINSIAESELCQKYTTDTLPAVIQISNGAEDVFLHRITSLDFNKMDFKLAPAFLIYMAARLKISLPAFNSTNSDAKNRLKIFLNDAAKRMMFVARNGSSKESIAYWLANSSELLNFYKMDVELTVLSRGTPQKILLECVQNTFNVFCNIIKNTLCVTLVAFCDANLDDQEASRSTVSVLEETILLMRCVRLNAALTIQLFSQFFHYISAMIFNWIVSTGGTAYCSRAFGVRLRNRINAINDWAYQHGLELAAECHMDRINQAVTLLITPKVVDQLSNLGATCYKLNSIQVRWLLEHIMLDVGEEPISREIFETIIHLAETHADKMTVQDGMSVQLEEHLHLQLPFLLPQDGYSSELDKGLAPAAVHFVNALQAEGICWLISQAHSSGSWNIHFITNRENANSASLSSASSTLYQAERNESNYCDMLSKSASVSSDYIHQIPSKNGQVAPSGTSCSSREERHDNVVTINLNRKSGGIGLSIVAAQGIGEHSVGIYVKKVVVGSVAHKDGRLEPGDQLLSVNGQSLIGIGQEEAAEKMTSSGSLISFEVLKHAARYNGLAEWLSYPPSVTSTQANGNNPDQLPPSRSVAQFKRTGDVHRFSPQNSIASTASFQSNNNISSLRSSHNNGHCYSGADKVTAAATVDASSHYANMPNDPYLNKNRSASASELYHNAVSASSVTSLSSLPPQMQRTVPSHYRALQRPVVLQPLRMSPSYSPTMRQLRSRSSSQMLNASSPIYHSNMRTTSKHDLANTSSSSSPITDYANLPLIENISDIKATSVSAAVKNCENAEFATYSVPQHSVTRTNKSNLLNSLLIPDAHDKSTVDPTANSQDGNLKHSLQKLQPPPVPPKRRTRRDELSEQLDQLELKGEKMTEDDRHMYRNLVNELGQICTPLSIVESSDIESSVDDTNKFMQRADHSSLSDKAKSPGVEKNSECQSQQDGTINLDSDDICVVTTTARALEVGDEDNNKQTSAQNGSRETDHSNSKARKGVQWGDNSGKLTITEYEIKELDTEEDSKEPRAQVIGAQEIYRDPRQRRLNEIRAQQQASQSKIDGSKLGFRDKMQLFAEQIGEKTVKNRYKSSAVQRNIEQIMDD